MPQPTFFVPVAFAQPIASTCWIGTPQEPKSISDTPAGSPQAVPGGGAPTGTPGAVTGQTGTPNGAPQSPCADGPMMWLFPIMLVVMWLFMIRPEQKRRKEQQALLAAIAVGDRVVTVSGMHGEVTSLTDKTVTLRVDTVKITFDRSAVARIDRGDAAAKTN